MSKFYFVKIYIILLSIKIYLNLIIKFTIHYKSNYIIYNIVNFIRKENKLK